MPPGRSYSPVAGVDFELLCAVTADVARQPMQTGQAPAPGTNPYIGAASARGIDAESWSRAQLVWGCRTMLDPGLGVEQGQAVARLMMPGMPDYSGMMPPPQVVLPPPVNPNDPALAPIEGVPIETYVRMIAVQIESPTLAPEEFADVAAQLGFPPDRWVHVMGEWGNRVVAGPPASLRYAQLVCELLG